MLSSDPINNGWYGPAASHPPLLSFWLGAGASLRRDAAFLKDFFRGLVGPDASVHPTSMPAMDENLSRRLRIGDQVFCEPISLDGAMMTGTIVRIIPASASPDLADYIVQIGPALLGVYKSHQLIPLGALRKEAGSEILVS
jgi:hypothetical protein